MYQRKYRNLVPAHARYGVPDAPYGQRQCVGASSPSSTGTLPDQMKRKPTGAPGKAVTLAKKVM
jgi:hypothetical protein